MSQDSSWHVSCVKAFTLSVAVVSLHSSLALAMPADPTKAEPTPPGQGTPVKEPIKERCQLLAEADKYAIDQLGFQDADKNGIPDYREKYVLNVTDCSTVSAQFDWILEQMAKNGALNPNQGFGACQLRGGGHAANLVPEIGIIDVTPSDTGASNGQCWFQFPNDTGRLQTGIPDPGERPDPAYGGPVQAPPVHTPPVVVVIPPRPVAPPVAVIVPVKPKPPVCVRPRQKGCIRRILPPRRR